MKQISRHKIFLAGNSYEHASSQVNRFFDRTTLVMYDKIQARQEKSFNGLDDNFFEELTTAEDYNQQIVQGFLDDLLSTGIKKTADLANIQQGYASKILHILSHFLDGFIGVDSYFFNIIDDSHWLLPQTKNAVRKSPQQYWLIHIDCFASTPGDAGLLHI
jgi:hypothetical protein